MGFLVTGGYFFRLRQHLLWVWPTLLISFGVSLNADQSQATDARLVQILHSLSSVPSGRQLIQRAKTVWQLDETLGLLSHLRWGTVSKTDTILTRQFFKPNGVAKLERDVTIYLRKDQPDLELLLDLAHELVHATTPPAFDPYDPKLTPGGYVRASIDGQGGEVDAVLAECSVAHELLGAVEKPVHRCQTYFYRHPTLDLGDGVAQKGLSRSRVAQDFYRVGKWYGEIRTQLGTEAGLFPFLKGEKPVFFSSAGHAPYPVALYQEYLKMNDVACENSLERKASLLASVDPSQVDPSQNQRVQSFITKRCR
jgi:hypothetical protein